MTNQMLPYAHIADQSDLSYVYITDQSDRLPFIPESRPERQVCCPGEGAGREGTGSPAETQRPQVGVQ